MTCTLPGVPLAARARRHLGHRGAASRGLLTAAMLLTDLVAIALAIGIAYLARQSALDPAGDLGESLALAALPVAVGWIAAIALLGAYDSRLLPTGPHLYTRLLESCLAAAGIVAAVVYLAGIELSRVFFLLLFLVGPVLLLAGRVLLRRTLNSVRSRGGLTRRVLVIGAPSRIDEVTATLSRETWLGYDVVGAVSGGSGGARATRCGVEILGRESELLRIVTAIRPDVLLFASGSGASAEEFRRTAWQLEDAGVEIIVVPALAEISADRVRMRPVAGLPLVHLDLPRAREALRWGKRAFDIAASLLLLVLTAPVLAGIAVAVRRSDDGPVLFRQQRVGRDGAPFELLKFRTMVTDAEALLAEMTERSVQDRGNTVMFKMRHDPRVTVPGRLLRRFSLDELPQLWNVVRGDMSLIGPRPALPREVDAYGEDAHRRHRVRPGITGLWQVSGRSDLSWAETVRLDLYYVDNWCFTQDLQILARTARAVLRPAGAY